MSDSIKFTELPAGTLGANSIFATSEDVGGGVYSSTKINAAALGAFLNNALQYAALNTEDNTIIGAINELFVYALNIANEYDSSSTYDEGDFVIYEGALYKCTTAITVAEAWNSAHWTSTLIVDNFGAGGGASVTLGTTVPSDASGSDGDLYVQYEVLTYKVVEYFVKINGSWRKFPYSRVVALTQAEYDLITPDPTTLYIITDAQSSYQTKTDNSLTTTDKTVVGAINELNTGKADASSLTSLLSQLDNITITHYNCEGNGGLLTLPSYEDFCIIFISRGEGGLYMGSWSGVTPIVSAPNHNVIYYSNPSRINVTNNSSTMDRITVIRK